MQHHHCITGANVQQNPYETPTLPNNCAYYHLHIPSYILIKMAERSKGCRQIPRSIDPRRFFRFFFPAAWTMMVFHCDKIPFLLTVNHVFVFQNPWKKGKNLLKVVCETSEWKKQNIWYIYIYRPESSSRVWNLSQKTTKNTVWGLKFDTLNGGSTGNQPPSSPTELSLDLALRLRLGIPTCNMPPTWKIHEISGH